MVSSIIGSRRRRRRSTATVSYPTPSLQDTSTQWQVTHLPFPFAFQTAFSYQHDVLYSEANGNFATNFKNARHRLASLNALIGMTRQRRDIMGKQHSPFFGSPFQYRRVIRSRKTSVLDSHNIQHRSAAQDTTPDIIVESFVSGLAKHAYRLPLARRANKRSRMLDGSKWDSFSL